MGFDMQEGLTVQGVLVKQGEFAGQLLLISFVPTISLPPKMSSASKTVSSSRVNCVSMLFVFMFMFVFIIYKIIKNYLKFKYKMNHFM